jgi:hypothetical protein
VLDARNGRRPLEIGVAIDEKGLEGLPAHGMPLMLRPPLPAGAPAPYRFVMLDWNPHGHEPEGIYDSPHFDFHFYRITHDEVMAMVPTDPNFVSRANDLPSGAYVPPFYTIATPDGASSAVPQMGVHWLDVRSPELQGVLGNPEGYRPFTKTFLYGSWAGEMIFYEPMITRAHLLTRPDEVIPIPQPALYPEPGWYPSAYRISWDPRAREYRVGLVGLEWKE